MTMMISSLTVQHLSPTYISLYACFVHDFIDIVCCYPWLNCACCCIQNFSGQSADFTHCILFFLLQDRNVESTSQAVLGLTVCRIIRRLYRVWEGAP